MIEAIRRNAEIAARLLFSPLSGVYWAITGNDWQIDPKGRERLLKSIFGED